MHKKICILNGSPRINGNTKELIKYFTKGAETVGHEVTCFDLQKMNIHGCLGCCNGGKNEDAPCVQKDDMSQIYPVYKTAKHHSLSFSYVLLGHHRSTKMCF